MKKLVKKIGVLSVCASSFSAFAVETDNIIDVTFVVDQEVVESFGREWVDQQILKGMKLSNQTLEMAQLPYVRKVNKVIIEPANGVVATATRGNQGALGGVQAGCETITSEFDYTDNIVWLVPESGNYNRMGNAGTCYRDNDIDQGVGKRNAVVSMGPYGYDHDIGVIIAHELGHADGLPHTHADAYEQKTGHRTLMSSSTLNNLTGPLISPNDVTALKAVDAGNDEWMNFFTWPAPVAPVVDDMATLEVNEDDVADSFEVFVNLPKAMDESVSVEFYTESVTAIADTDYEQHVQRYMFLAGETRKSIEVNLLNNSSRYEDRILNVGIRYGEGVNTQETKLSVTVAKVADEPDQGSGSTGGSSSGGGSLGIFSSLMLLLLMWRRK